MKTLSKWLWDWAKISAAAVYLGFLVGWGFRL